MSGRGAPGANSRGRGGKFKKFTRGGGKHFSRDLRPLDADGNEISMWSMDAQEEGEEGSEEEESEEDSSSEDSDAGPSNAQKGDVSREDRKQAKKAKKEAAAAKKKGPVQVGDMPTDSEEEEDGDMPVNPNHSKAARNMAKGIDQTTEGVEKMSLTRKEREALEAQQAKERYRKLHEAGKTDEAKADLARLKLIREKREAEAARKQAEKEEKDAHDKARKAEIQAKEAKKREAALGGKGKKKAGK
ncbi:hypothetical protein F4779DRAFT_576525 [Xylariaceae sp. FL0662B]|nr:hypothetical protein F4779DRAFT_576525 [Xylariaceae sp. FL0662B]